MINPFVVGLDTVVVDPGGKFPPTGGVALDGNSGSLVIEAGVCVSPVSLGIVGFCVDADVSG